MHIFLGKRIITQPTTHRKLDAVVHAKSVHFPLPLPPSILLFIHRFVHHNGSHTTTTGEIDQTSIITGNIAVSGSKSDRGMGSEAASASSSSNMAV
jgi:hypothetical protein